MLNPFRYGFLSIQLISHKLLRWSVPWFMIGMAITNVFLIRESSFYFMIFLAQITFYVLAVVGHFLQERRLKTVLLKVPYFFCTVNLAILAAWWKYFSGKRYVTWEPSKRSWGAQTTMIITIHLRSKGFDLLCILWLRNICSISQSARREARRSSSISLNSRERNGIALLS